MHPNDLSLSVFHRMIRDDISSNGDVPSIEEILRAMGGGILADIGCYGWRLDSVCQSHGARLVGFDTVMPPSRPLHAAFAKMDGTQLSHHDDAFDIVVASHVIEHMSDALPLVCEMMRITKPGGLVWIEAPSELSLHRRTQDGSPENQDFGCFWDDPTHVRPQTPGSLYRLAISSGLIPLCISRCDDGIPSVRMLALKPDFFSGKKPSRYVTLRDVAPGAIAAWLHVWPEYSVSMESLEALARRSTQRLSLPQASADTAL